MNIFLIRAANVACLMSHSITCIHSIKLNIILVLMYNRIVNWYQRLWNSHSVPEVHLLFCPIMIILFHYLFLYACHSDSTFFLGLQFKGSPDLIGLYSVQTPDVKMSLLVFRIYKTLLFQLTQAVGFIK